MKWHCPTCKKPTDSAAHMDFPFCSERCHLLDLGNWASERYVVSEPVNDEAAPKEPGPMNPSLEATRSSPARARTTGNICGRVLYFFAS